MNNDDLLSFKEFEPVHDSYARGGARAEININSPKRQIPPHDDLQHLIDDMSTSVQILATENAGQMQQGEGNFDLSPSSHSLIANPSFSIE